jgi:hypothetical protein
MVDCYASQSRIENGKFIVMKRCEINEHSTFKNIDLSTLVETEEISDAIFVPVIPIDIIVPLPGTEHFNENPVQPQDPHTSPGWKFDCQVYTDDGINYKTICNWKYSAPFGVSPNGGGSSNHSTPIEPTRPSDTICYSLICYRDQQRGECICITLPGACPGENIVAC